MDLRQFQARLNAAFIFCLLECFFAREANSMLLDFGRLFVLNFFIQVFIGYPEANVRRIVVPSRAEIRI